MAKKHYDDDDGRSIVDMNVEGIPGYIKPEHLKNMNEIQKLNLTKKEKRALFWGSFLAMLPPMLIAIASLGFTFFLMYLWLK